MANDENMMPRNPKEQILFEIKCHIYFGNITVEEIQSVCEEALADRLNDLKYTENHECNMVE